MGQNVEDCVFFLPQYDFSLERKTIQWAEEIKQIKAAQREAELKAEAACSQAEPDPTNESQENEAMGCPPPINPIMASFQHNHILTPTPANSSAIPQKVLTHAKADFNPADFECEEDPFDKLELKTIDDKEELKSILGVHNRPAPNRDSGKTDAARGFRAPVKDEDPLSTMKQEVLDFKHLCKPNGFITLPQLGDCDLPPSSKVSLAPITSVSNIKSLSFPKLDSDDGDLKKASATTCLPNGTFLDSIKSCSPNNSSELNGLHIRGPTPHLDNGIVQPTLPPSSLAAVVSVPPTEEISRTCVNNDTKVRRMFYFRSMTARYAGRRLYG